MRVGSCSFAAGSLALPPELTLYGGAELRVDSTGYESVSRHSEIVDAMSASLQNKVKAKLAKTDGRILAGNW